MYIMATNKTKQPKGSTEMQITYREYWTEVRSLAEQIAKESIETGNDANDILAETVDGHEYVIYYAKQLDVLNHTDNENALFDFVGTLEADSFTDATTKLAYWAFYQDVQDYLQDALDELEESEAE